MAYSYLQFVRNTAGQNTIAVTPSSAGNLIVLFSITSGGAGNPTATVADNQGGTWADAISSTSYNTNTLWLTVFYCKSTVNTSATTITVTYNGGTPGEVDLLILEYSGLDTAAPLITATHNKQDLPGTSTDAITTSGGTGSANVTSQPALIIGYGTYRGGSFPTLSSGTGFTQRAYDTATYRNMLEDKRVTATGNQYATFTTNEDLTNYMTAMVAFKEPSVVSNKGRLMMLGVG